MADKSITMLRPKEICRRSGKCRTTLYNEVSEGLMPRLVPVGARAKALPEHEVDAVNAARIAGKSTAEIKSLVRRLEANRVAA